MIRIAYFIDTIATAGAGTEQQLLMLLKSLDRREFEPLLVCLRPSRWLETNDSAVEVAILDVPSLLRPNALRALHRFKTLHAQRRFDIVQTFFIDANIFGTLAARFARVGVVLSCRRDIGYWHTWYHRRILRQLSRWTTHYLANSEAAAAMIREAEGVATDRVSVIYNGLELDRFARVATDAAANRRSAWGVAPTELLVGTVANLRAVKNIPSLIEAAAELAGEFPQARFVVVGEGADRESLQQAIAGRGLTERFHLVGAYDDVPVCLGAFDIAVQCSASESFSNALIEYMAAGLPVAASRVGGNPEAVAHEVTGLLYDQTGGALAAALRRLLRDPAQRARLGEAARRDAQRRFSRAVCVARHEDIYRRLAGAGSRR